MPSGRASRRQSLKNVTGASAGARVFLYVVPAC